LTPGRSILSEESFGYTLRDAFQTSASSFLVAVVHIILFCLVISAARSSGILPFGKKWSINLPEWLNFCLVGVVFLEVKWIGPHFGRFFTKSSGYLYGSATDKF
jgi:hypothetical protein